jgi:hypothetical protein
VEADLMVDLFECGDALVLIAASDTAFVAITRVRSVIAMR